MLFLHAFNESGTDYQRQMKVISDWTSDSSQLRNPCFVVVPHVPEWKEIFQIYGYSRDQAITSYLNYMGSEGKWKHYQIPAGKYYSGKMSSLVLFNDTWRSDAPIESSFRDVKVYEAGQSARAKPLDLRKLNFSPYAGGGRGNNPKIVDDGSSVQLVGDTRLKVPFSYNVTMETVLEFDFKSSKQGNVHGIGFDDNDELFNNRWVQVDTGAVSHSMPAEPSTPLRLVMELLPALQ